MILPHGVDVPALLVACALVGRVLLSVLPPGLPGRHAPAELPATWAASHLLGAFALSLEASLLALLRADVSLPLFFAPWILLALARFATLPGAMVPRHPLPREPAGPLPLALFVIAVGLVVAATILAGGQGAENARRTAGATRFFGRLVARAPDSLDVGAWGAADALALLALASHALAQARRAPITRAVVVLVLASAIAAAIHWDVARSFALPLAVGGGAALGIPWLRRADRRAGALSVLAFASAALLGPREALFGIAGIAALWIHTAVPSRRQVAIFAACTFLPAAALGWLHLDHPPQIEDVLPGIGALSLFVVTLALATRHRLVLARGGSDADTVRLGAPMLRDALLLAILPPICRGEIETAGHVAATLLELAPIAIVEAGILLGRAESTAR